MSGEYVTIYEEYKHKFFQIPKIFFTSERYKNLSNNAKIAWALLRDRSSVSRKNNWFDEDTGRVYFIYRNPDLMTILNFGSENTVIKVKNELTDFGLIEEVRRPNRPNKIYLKYPIIDEKDIEKIDELENYSDESTEREKAKEALDTTGTAKSATTKSAVPELQKVQSSYTKCSYIKYLDTIDTENTGNTENNVNNFNSEKEKLSEGKRDNILKLKYMNEAYFNNFDRISKRLAKVLDAFSESIEQADEYYKIILQAKKKVEQEVGFAILLENMPELEQGVIHAFSRAIRKIEQERDINNPGGYIYQTIYQFLSREINYFKRKKKFDLKADDDTESKIVFYDWLEGS